MFEELMLALELAALISAALGIPLALYQLRKNHQQTVTAYEDDLTREYRAIIKGVSVDILLGI